MPRRLKLASGLPIFAKPSVVKDCVHLFVIYTVLQVVFVTFYYLLARTVNATLCIGTILYAIAMWATYLSYRDARYQKQRKELLDALP